MSRVSACSSRIIASLIENVDLEKSLKCYERRRKCLKHRGWCYTDQEYGYCSELNEIPDTPDPVQPLMEIQTFILPKETCKNVPQLVQSESRICTGHVTRGPSEYIFQVLWALMFFGSFYFRTENAINIPKSRDKVYLGVYYL